MKFVERKTAPSLDNKWYYSNLNPYYPNPALRMPNCTTYAIGRYMEIQNKEIAPTLNTGWDATTIYWHAKNDANSQFKNLVGQTPKLGAIICWSTRKDDNPSAGASDGHVAVVEYIHSNGDITCSNSAYRGTNFYMQRYSKANGFDFVGSKDKKHYYLQGFVYQSINFEEEEQKPTPSPTPSDDFKVGDKVKVYGVATENAQGGGEQTLPYDGEELYITKIAEGNPRPYHVSRGNKLGEEDRGWVAKDQIKKA